MYERYYGLQERPFDLSPNARFLFLSRKHLEALTHLEYALTGRPGLTVLTGEAGTGKTTLIRTALHRLSAPATNVVHVANPTLTRAEFYDHLASCFGFSAEAAGSKAKFLRELEHALWTRPAEGSAGMAMVIDEAQSMPHELLEEVRLLGNLDSPSGRSLGVILVGQPELSARLDDPSLRQLKQRVALRCELGTLDLAETGAYIAARVRAAGGRAEDLFTRDAVVSIHRASTGIPRTISVICDNALVTGFAAGERPIGEATIVEVCRDFHIDPPVSLDPEANATRPATTPVAAATEASVAAAPDAAARTATATAVAATPEAAGVVEDSSGETGEDGVESSAMFSGFTKRRRFFGFTR